MKNKFLLGLLALSTLGLANVFEAKVEVNEEVAKGGSVFTATKANQKNKLEVQLNDTFTVTGKLEHDFSPVLTGDSGLSVKADLKEMGSLELNTFLTPKASLGYTYKTNALGLSLEANAKYTEEAKFSKNTLEAGLKGTKEFDSTLKAEGRTKLQYAIHESKVTPEVGGMVEYKPVEGLVLKTDLNFNTPITITKEKTTAKFEFKFKKKVLNSSIFAFKNSSTVSFSTFSSSNVLCILYKTDNFSLNVNISDNSISFLSNG